VLIAGRASALKANRPLVEDEEKEVMAKMRELLVVAVMIEEKPRNQRKWPGWIVNQAAGLVLSFVTAWLWSLVPAVPPTNVVVSMALPAAGASTTNAIDQCGPGGAKTPLRAGS
jgi:hypothetical protein